MSVLTQDDITTQSKTKTRKLRAMAIPADILREQGAMAARHRYRIDVKQRGCHVASYIVKADDALSAISNIERLYGRPVSLIDGSIQDKDGIRHHIMVAHDWHGYTYAAEKLEIIGKTGVNHEEQQNGASHKTA